MTLRALAMLLAALVILSAACDTRRTVRRDAGPGGADSGAPDAPSAVDAPFTIDAPSTDARAPADDTALAADAFLPVDARVAPADAGRDAAVSIDATVPRDAFVPVDARSAADAAGDAYVPPGGETFDFPTAADPRVASAGLYFWRAGDNVEGTRVAVTPSITSLTVSLVLETNGLTCDTQDVRVLVNGVEVGTFSIATPDTVIARTFTFPPITGPSYTFRYETITEVAGGCGSSGYSNTGSTVTIR